MSIKLTKPDGSNFDLGEKPTITATFKDESGTLIDPGVITIKVLDPDKAETDYTTANGLGQDSTGVWSVEIAQLGKPGRWFIRVDSTGNLVTATEAHLWVERTAFTNP